MYKYNLYNTFQQKSMGSFQSDLLLNNAMLRATGLIVKGDPSYFDWIRFDTDKDTFEIGFCFNYEMS